MTKFMYKNDFFFFKFRDEKQTFKSLMMKTELHLKLKDENNTFTKTILSFLRIIQFNYLIF